MTRPLTGREAMASAYLSSNSPLCPPAYDRHAARVGDRLPTPRELLPRRPKRRPRWVPGLSHLLRDEAHVRTHAPAAVRYRSSEDLGHVRVNFRYRNWFSTAAHYSQKARRAQYTEGPHELNFLRWFSINPLISDFQFQPIELEICDEFGNVTVYTLDVAVELVSGGLVFAEIKPVASYFHLPEVVFATAAAEDALAREGAAFERLRGDLFDEVTAGTIADVYAHRLEAFDIENDYGTIETAIESGGGVVDLRTAKAVLGGRPSDARAKLDAMMAARLIAIDVSLPPTAETPVRLAPPARRPRALRDFLERFVRQED